MAEHLTMNKAEFAARVGVSVSTVNRLLAEGSVSCTRIASRVLFTEAHAEELLKKFEVRAREPKGRLRVKRR
jgi:predicted site-specific integrase-resolvase